MEKQFDSLVQMIDRNGMENLLAHLKENGYFNAPSSSKYHGAEEKGNIVHSLSVTEIMLRLRPHIAPDVSEESCVIVGLFHDLGKCNYFGKPNYTENLLKNGKRSESKPYTSNKDRLPIPHQIVSLHILSKFIELTEDETFAILYHNGLYTPDGRTIQGKETPLMLLLHFADMWSSRFVETEYETIADGKRW